MILASLEAFVGKTKRCGGDSVLLSSDIFVVDLGLLLASSDFSGAPFVALVLGIFRINCDWEQLVGLVFVLIP